MRSTKHRISWLVAVALAVVGCRYQSMPATAPVQGLVTLDGVPLTKGTVYFYPDRSKGTAGRLAVGVIGGDGRYSLTSFVTGDGAIPGHHAVTVICETDPPSMEQVAASPNFAIRSLIPKHYNKPASSGLTAEVRPGGINQYDIRLDSKFPSYSSGRPSR